MSGPKITVYQVSPEQLKRLQLQNTCRKKFLVHTQWWKESREKLTPYVKESEELLGLTNTDYGFFQQKKELETLAEEEFLQLNKGSGETSIPFLETILKESHEREKQLKFQWSNLMEIVGQNKMLLEEQVAQRKHSLDSASCYNFDFSGESHSDSEELLSFKENYLINLHKYQKSHELSSELQEKINLAIPLVSEMKDLTFLKNAIAIQLKPLIAECEAYQVFVEKQKSIEEAVTPRLTEYLVLCEMLQQTPKKFPLQSESLVLLEQEVVALEEQLESMNQQNYIHETIQDVMEEMGYNLLGNREVTKKNGSHFRNELFNYEDGTAVNITYASNGQISMELGGLSSDDHFPNQEETPLLCQAMESFCGDFQILEKKLAEKGVVLGKRLSHLPSEATYAQMINVNDYDLVETASLLEMKQKKTTLKRKKSKYLE